MTTSCRVRYRLVGRSAIPGRQMGAASDFGFSDLAEDVCRGLLAGDRLMH
jgi:hypothetical protein